MEDVKELFLSHQGQRVDIEVSTGKSVSGEISTVQENHVVISSSGALYYIFHRQIIWVKSLPPGPPGQHGS